MNTENPIIHNFDGVAEFTQLLEGAALLINDAGQQITLDRDNNLRECDPSSIRKVGITFKSGIDPELVGHAADAAGIAKEDVDLVLVAEDPFLKERDVLVSTLAVEATEPIPIAGQNGRRARSLENSNMGLSIEAWLVLNKPLPPQPGRVRRLGTKLAGLTFNVVSYPDASGLTPLPLTEEIISANDLSTKTQLFVDINGSLLQADSLEDVVHVYADSDLLADLHRRRRGNEFNFIASGMAVSALQQIVFALSTELQGDPDFDCEAEESPVLEFIHQKLTQAPGKQWANLTKQVAVDIVRSKPHVATSAISTLGLFASSARRLLAPVTEEEE